MSQLTPCPECQRHVRKTEASCPFCESALSLSNVPSPALPRKRLGRAATFAFGASVVGATALVACSDGDSGGDVPVYGAPPAAGAGGDSSFGGSAAPVYGAPAAGAPNFGGSSGNPQVGGAGGEGGASGAAGSAGADTDPGGEGGGAFAVYGAPAGGDGNL
jgi:hypothetical protein